MSWVVGSLFAKYKKTDAPATVNTSWQMFFAGIYFLAGAFISGEFKTFQLWPFRRSLVFDQLPDHIWLYSCL